MSTFDNINRIKLLVWRRDKESDNYFGALIFKFVFYLCTHLIFVKIQIDSEIKLILWERKI